MISKLLVPDRSQGGSMGSEPTRAVVSVLLLAALFGCEMCAQTTTSGALNGWQVSGTIFIRSGFALHSLGLPRAR